LHRPPIIVFASPGGGYARGYFDLPPFQGEAYSQAEHHVAAGFILVAYDHLGTGDSTCPERDDLSNEQIAAANDAAVRTLIGMFEEGKISDRLPPLQGAFKIGLGQSLGGCLTILMQGAHRTFDAIVPLAASAVQGVLPQPTEAARRAGIEGFAAAAADGGIDFVYPFFWDDTPREILDADQQGGFPVRETVPPWGSKTIPRCASLFMTPGHLAAPAASVEVPVFIGLGERDTCADPLGEPASFARSRDVSVFIVPRMAHMHNFASTRKILWDRIVAWSKAVGTG
jgi:pimeloyl-ACP methyl ester carboxylesterase